jgi:hypothetical protein
LEYKINKPDTLGKLCIYPSHTYSLSFDGTVSIVCTGAGKQNLIQDGFPAISSEPVACPLNKCIGCTDMYRGIIDEMNIFNNPHPLYSLKNYAEDIATWRKNN